MNKEELQEEVINLLKEKIIALENEMQKLEYNSFLEKFRDRYYQNTKEELKKTADLIVKYNYTPTAYCFKGNKSLVVIS